METVQENKAILLALREEFPQSCFVVIRTNYLSETDQTEVTYISSVNTKDTKKLLQGTYLMIDKKDN